MNPNDLQPAILVIFGISGDLARRKVLPAIYHLFKDNLLPEHIEIVGTSRRELSIDELLSDVELCVLESDNVCDPDALQRFRDHLRLEQINPVAGEDYERLKSVLSSIEAAHGVCMHRLYYLSIPPQVYSPIIRELGEHGLNQACEHGNGQARLLVEKPFGYDLKSAVDLIETTNAVFDENQIFRIDHYLAKESAQNILTFRQQNPLFRDVWNNQHIDSVHVAAYEKIGIEGRGNFYDSIGALRDLVQSHLLQLMALTTMQLPAAVDNTLSLHEQKQQLLEATTIYPAAGGEPTITRGQYRSYRDEVGNTDSMTETFVSLQVWIKHPEWEGVPVTLSTGKALLEKRTEVTVRFKAPGSDGDANQLTFRIQPNEGIDVGLTVKKPGFAHELQGADMDFSYMTTFNEDGHPDAYERVLVDAVRGDHLLFATSEEVLASWRILQPVLDLWQKSADDLKFYDTGADPATIN